MKQTARILLVLLLLASLSMGAVALDEGVGDIIVHPRPPSEDAVPEIPIPMPKLNPLPEFTLRLLDMEGNPVINAQITIWAPAELEHVWLFESGITNSKGETLMNQRENPEDRTIEAKVYSVTVRLPMPTDGLFPATLSTEQRLTLDLTAGLPSKGPVELQLLEKLPPLLGEGETPVVTFLLRDTAGRPLADHYLHFWSKGEMRNGVGGYYRAFRNDGYTDAQGRFLWARCEPATYVVDLSTSWRERPYTRAEFTSDGVQPITVTITLPEALLSSH